MPRYRLQDHSIVIHRTVKRGTVIDPCTGLTNTPWGNRGFCWICNTPKAQIVGFPALSLPSTRSGSPNCCLCNTLRFDLPLACRRQILIPLWNSYAFFINYARLDEFDPGLPPVPMEERGNGDPWILSNLQELIETAHREMQAFNVSAFCEATATFIDDLSTMT